MARKVVWGIDIGQTALRAVKGIAAGGRIDVLGFDSIEYEEILSAPDVDRDNAIQQALRMFLARNRISAGDIVLACIPGQSALIRFIKLPPVDKKRIPDIVRYEAHQQIPFPLEEVVWDYKPLEGTVGPADQVEVGIFAMRRDIVHGFLSNLMVCDLDVDILQLAPMALYNYVAYDNPIGEEAQLVIDMGAENTELLICTGNSVWPRSLPVSGNDFTEALMEKFKVPFDKAEALKRMAKQSKYSKQIYHAIETPLRRVVEEVQRSIGYYKSINPGVRISGILALGGSFRLPGLGKYLSERLHMPIRSLTEPQNFNMGGARNPRVFQESALSFGVALGLVVQGCGMGNMDISLLPQELLQRKIIARKKPWAAAVAACALLMFATAWYSTWRTGKELDEAASQRAKDFVKRADEMERDYRRLIDVSGEKKKLDQLLSIWQGRDLWLKALRKVYKPVLSAEDKSKGPWLRKAVSARVPFDVAAGLLAAEKIERPTGSGVGFKSTGMELDSGYVDRLIQLAKSQESALTPDVMTRGGARGRMRTEIQPKLKRPDVVYMVLQGQTTHPKRGGYVDSVLQNNLTNTWRCSKCGKTVKGITPPARCSTVTDGGPCEGTLELADAPLIADVRYVGDTTERRFINHRGRQVNISDLGGEWSREWQSIQDRLKLIENKTYRNWTDGDIPDEKPLRTREQFLSDLADAKSVVEEEFTDFEISFFLDPSGELLKEVAKLKAQQASATGFGPKRPLRGPYSGRR